jgi:Ca2+-binding RTX toxin-like protein
MGIRNGTSGNDRLIGISGVKDVFRGFSGSDVLRGSGASDHDVADYSQDYRFGALHGIKVNLSAEQSRAGLKPDSALDSFGFKDKVPGIADVIGTPFADVIHGGGHDNVLTGGGGNDLLNGHAANDRLIGGLGADKLYGGQDSDTFVFTKLLDSTVAKGGRDTIYDFSQSEADKISLSAIDANAKAKGNQDFTFIGNEAFHHTAGELHTTHVSGNTIVAGDVNGDGKADFSILLRGIFTLTDSDFIL